MNKDKNEIRQKKDVSRLGRLRALVARLPLGPGVYIMKDGGGSVIYVGKAKSLRSRVRSYFAGGDDRPNVPYLLERVCNIEIVSTEDERQAIFLEMDLIRKYKPRYNIRLKDDKAPFLVRIDLTSEWPRLELVRNRQDDSATYLGPFPHTFELRALLEVVRNSIPLRSCSDRVLYNRVRPCLEYQIKRCLAPCCHAVNKTQYSNLVAHAIAVLQGRNEEVEVALRGEMLLASEDLRFEDAATLRDRLQVLQRIRDDQNSVTYSSVDGSDAFGLYREGSSVEVAVVQVRWGRIAGGQTFGFSDVVIDDLDVLESVIEQYYSHGREVPRELIVPHEVSDGIIELLKERRGGAVDLVIPQRGTRFRIRELALNNARENFRTRFEGERHGEEACRALQKELELEQLPRSIECVDISHFQGASTVASVVHFKDGEPDKSRYRLFHLSQEGKPDDFASMREVVKRHISRGAEEGTLCDLLVIDGGPGQLAQALDVRAELGLLQPAMVGLAKKRTISMAYGMERTQRMSAKPERVYLAVDLPPVILKPGSAELNLLERIRDEAHRFAISFHRRTRAKRNFHSLLDDIPGIGQERRKALLRVYSSAKRIAKASPQEISEKCGLPYALAQAVVKTLNKTRE